MSKLELKVGHTYYLLTFADRDKTMPGVEPLVYLGDADPSEGVVPHVFQDTVSYVRFGSRLDMKQDHDEVTIYFIPPEDIGSGIVDVQQVAAAVSAAAQRAATLNNPVLPILRDGWRSVP
jgi:hypothetical protein